MTEHPNGVILNTYKWMSEGCKEFLWLCLEDTCHLSTPMEKDSQAIANSSLLFSRWVTGSRALSEVKKQSFQGFKRTGNHNSLLWMCQDIILWPFITLIMYLRLLEFTSFWSEEHCVTLMSVQQALTQGPAPIARRCFVSSNKNRIVVGCYVQPFLAVFPNHWQTYPQEQVRQ